MDFGLARQDTEGGGSVSGTPAYMAPEHAAGQTLDARADVYSAGVVLAEMVSPEGIKSFESRQSVWEGVRSEPAKLPDSPWAPVLKKAVAKDREGRFKTAHTLTRALEDVTLRVEGAEDLHPYPGLASFTEEDAEYFFGREAEVEQMWRKLEGPPRMLALVGPSGAGKTSFLQAGLFPTATARWATVICKPRNNPQLALGRALAPEMAGDTDVMDLLLRFDDPDVAVEVLSRWRQRNDRALLVVDQFEELFTQNSAEEQRRFADLLNRLVLDADVCVLLSMRDDFMIRCRDFDAFKPTFADMTALPTLAGQALRRALVRPATKCGYRFEDDELVEEMLAEVEGERGALPLLAFAAAQLWEKRDRETGLLTRAAYHDIGGVGGALSRHAEATIDRIGTDRIAIVRELFRNLVTAEGTRAVREWNELLSVFDPGDVSRAGINPAPTKNIAAAEEVLRELIDVRLLTSYEVREEDHEPTRRVEIIHESLLANWPRLVRWQTQDADAAQLRDQLRQAAKTWDDQGRSDDTLWTGSTYREFAVWRERYPGGLTEIEEAFAAAMRSLATRRRRRRRVAAAAVLALALVVAIVFATLWRRSVLGTRRAEAAELVAIGQLELDSYPSATVAYTIASVELADSPTARRLALEALLQGPTALVASEDFAWRTRFSPDGRSLVQAQYLFANDAEGHLSFIRDDGNRESLENAHLEAPTVGLSRVSASGHFASHSYATAVKVVLWSVDSHRPVAETVLDSSQVLWQAVVDSARKRLVILNRDDDVIRVDTLGFDGKRAHLGTLGSRTRRDESGRWTTVACLDQRAGAWLGVVTGEEVFVVGVGDRELGPPRLIGRHEGVLSNLAGDPLGRFIVTAGRNGDFRFWSLTDRKIPSIEQGPVDPPYFDFTPDGSLFSAVVEEGDSWIVWVWDTRGDQPRFLRKLDIGGTSWGFYELDDSGRYIVRSGPDTSFRLWSLNGPADADPIVLHRGDNEQANDVQLSPQGGWLATADAVGLAFWPLTRDYPIVIRGHDGQLRGLVFDPHGRWLVSSAQDGRVRLWPLEGDPPPPTRELGFGGTAIAVSPDGSQILAGSQGGVGRPNLFFAEGGSPRTLPRSTNEIWSVAFSPDGRRAAGIGGQFNPAERVIVVWDVVSEEEVKTLEVGEEPIVYDLQFTQNGHLLFMCASGLLRWNVETGERELLYEGPVARFDASPDGRRVVLVEKEDPSDLFGNVVLLELDLGTVTPLDRFGVDVTAIALDPTGTVAATGDRDGEVRVGQVARGEPHLFLGHESGVERVAIDPLGRWIASGGYDGTVRLWPMPDLSKPPLHTLPRSELIAKLKTLTNLRVVRDEESATGWKLEVGPFPGWETVPEW
jgi:WD40 repeat protein